MQRITVIGPNLRDQSKGSFLVHAAGCADLSKLSRHEPEVANGWTFDATSRTHVCDELYPPEEDRQPPHARARYHSQPGMGPSDLPQRQVMTPERAFEGVAPGQSFPDAYGTRRAAPVTLDQKPPLDRVRAVITGQLSLDFNTGRKPCDPNAPRAA